MTPEKYKHYIAEMLDSISDEKHLRRIYNVVHRAFINEGIRESSKINLKGENIIWTQE